MRLAVISDIHGNLLALEAVIADIGARGVDATVNLGDNVAGPLWPRETAERLVTLALPTVRGNHDRWMLDREDDSFARAALTIEQRRALHALPPTINIGEDILPVHGTPTDDCAFLTEEMYLGRMIPVSRGVVSERLGAAIYHSVSPRTSDPESGLRRLPSLRRYIRRQQSRTTLTARALCDPHAAWRPLGGRISRARLRLGASRHSCGRIWISQMGQGACNWCRDLIVSDRSLLWMRTSASTRASGVPTSRTS
jgi:hypothetical protein